MRRKEATVIITFLSRETEAHTRVEELSAEFGIIAHVHHCLPISFAETLAQTVIKGFG
jgi:hypothetical protein